MALTKVQTIGIETGISLAGVTTVVTLNASGNVTAVDGTFTGNVSVAGTLTYEDVTNVDSVGLITARNGVSVTGGDFKVGSATTISQDNIFTTGIVTATSFYGDGSNLTGIDATQIVTGDTSVQTTDTGSDGTIKFNTDGSERARIDSSGRFGIGTNNPQRELHVQGSTNGTIRVQAANSATSQLLFSDSDAEIRGRVGYYHPDDALDFYSAGQERARIDSSGRLLIGTSTSRSVDNEKILQIEGVDQPSSSMSLTRNTNSGAPPNITFGKSRGTATGSNTIVQSGDSLGFIGFAGADGADLNTLAASIVGAVDGTPGSNDMPGRLVFSTTADGASGPTERMRINSSGRLLIGTSTERRRFFNSDGEITTLQIEGSGVGTKGIHHLSITSNNTSTSALAGANQVFARSRGGIGDYDILSNGDAIGALSFQGADSTDFVEAARIAAFVDGAMDGTNECPGRLAFYTTADNGNSPTERLRITSDGFVNVNDSGVIYNSDGYTNANLFVYDVRQGGHTGTFVNNHVSYNQANHGVLWSGCSRSASSGYVLFAASSGNGNSLNYGSDIEFRLYGDGNGKCDGSWTGGGADYAEMFEWVDGNPDSEDRRGLSVVLEGNKIRAAVDGEDPIGVISANPTILGDAAWNKWTEKHLRDDFGSYVYEEHNVLEWTDEEGKEHNYEDWNIPADVVVPDDAVISTHDGNGKRFTHRAVNPAYDPDREYIPREERQEWDAVGLMGKLRIRKGQVTGARWIKMRDISDSVEEWLVR